MEYTIENRIEIPRVNGQEDYILRVQDLVKAYRLGDGSDLTVLDHMNVDFPRGQLIMLMGRSGSGKTTLMNMLSTLDDMTSGEILFQGSDMGGISVNDEADSEEDDEEDDEEKVYAGPKSLSDVIRYSEINIGHKEKLRRYKMGFVFQSVALIPVMTAIENIEFGLRTAGIKKNREKRINEVLEMVGLADRGKHYPGELSGGERQRIAIARAIAHRPQILFADEPTGALDTATGIYIAELFKKMTKEEGLTVIMTTHDVRLSELADMLVRLT